MKKWIRSKSIAFWMGTGVCTCLFLIIGVYTYTRMSEIIHGVQVTANIQSTTDGTTVSKIVGTAKNATYVSLNGREISIDKNGAFEEDMVLPNGYSIVTLSAEDAFGKSMEKTLDVYTVNNQAVAYVSHSSEL